MYMIRNVKCRGLWISYGLATLVLWKIVVASIDLKKTIRWLTRSHALWEQPMKWLARSETNRRRQSSCKPVEHTIEQQDLYRFQPDVLLLLEVVPVQWPSVITSNATQILSWTNMCVLLRIIDRHKSIPPRDWLCLSALDQCITQRVRKRKTPRAVFLVAHSQNSDEVPILDLAVDAPAFWLVDE